MRLRISYITSVLMVFAPLSAWSQTMPDLHVPEGTVMICQFDRQVSKLSKMSNIKTEKTVDYYAIISRKSAQLCVGGDTGCKRLAYAGNDGGSLTFVSAEGLKMTTDVAALASGAHVSVEDRNTTLSTSYSGLCYNADIALIKKGLPDYEE
jgi:hypothetical protein